MRNSILALGAVSLLAGVDGCSAGGDKATAPGIGNGGNGGSTFISTGSVPGNGGAFGNGGVFGNGGQNGSGGACSEVTQQSEKILGGKADIIFVVDNSGSMTEEVAAVGNNMNSFATQIINSGIDVRVVVISAPICAITDLACFASIGFTNFNGVCVDYPLGVQGQCPNGNSTNPPGYTHIRVGVDSHNALEQIQNTYSQWSGVLRPDSAKTFVVISDDESNVPAATFQSWVAAQPLIAGSIWRFSGIYCPAGGVGGGNCAGTGTVYDTLVAATGGIKGDMGAYASGQVDAQFKLVFDSLATAVKADAKPVDCEWAIPTPTNGELIDFNTVNVKYSPGGNQAQAQSIYWVADINACTTDYLGWYYDNPSAPSRVKACPNACTIMQADTSALVQVSFGCQREEPPIR